MSSTVSSISARFLPPSSIPTASDVCRLSCRLIPSSTFHFEGPSSRSYIERDERELTICDLHFSSLLAFIDLDMLLVSPRLGIDGKPDRCRRRHSNESCLGVRFEG